MSGMLEEHNSACSWLQVEGEGQQSKVRGHRGRDQACRVLGRQSGCGVRVQGCWSPWAHPDQPPKGKFPLSGPRVDPLPSLSRLCPQGAPQPLPCPRGADVPEPQSPEKELQERSVLVQKTCVHLWYLKRRHSGCWDCLSDVLGGTQAELLPPPPLSSEQV